MLGTEQVGDIREGEAPCASWKLPTRQRAGGQDHESHGEQEKRQRGPAQRRTASRTEGARAGARPSRCCRGTPWAYCLLTSTLTIVSQFSAMNCLGGGLLIMLGNRAFA